MHETLRILHDVFYHPQRADLNINWLLVEPFFMLFSVCHSRSTIQLLHHEYYRTKAQQEFLLLINDFLGRVLACLSNIKLLRESSYPYNGAPGFQA